MKQIVTVVAAACLAVQGVASAQGKDARAVLADARAALGGDKLAAVKTLSAEGRTLRTGPDGNTREMEFEMALELPDKYLMRSVMMAMGNMSIYRNTGFNGGQAIEEIDRPPNLAGGNIVIRIAGPGGTTDPETMTAEQRAEMQRVRLAQNRKDFARMALGMFAAAPAVYPLEFTYAGEAESPDGKADVIDVTGEGDFAARLFVDQTTRLPLMLSWMDKEPISVQMGPGGMAAGPGGGGGVALPGGGTFVQRTETGPPPSREDMEKRMKEFEAKRKELEAARRTVEFRVYYADYQPVGGVRLPHRIQRSIDGKPTEEMIFDTLKVNPKIDAKKFQVSK